MDMSHARLSLFGIIKILEEMKALIFCRRQAYSRWWFVAPHFGVWAGCATGLLFSGAHEAKAVSCKRAEHAQVSGLFIS